VRLLDVDLDADYILLSKFFYVWRHWIGITQLGDDIILDVLKDLYYLLSYFRLQSLLLRTV
jgi:hypothetical protein